MWTFVNQKRDMFLNPLYNPEPNGKKRVLFPDTSNGHMKLWTGYYCRWNPRMRPQDCVKTRQTQLLAIKDQFKTKMEALKRELESKRKNPGSRSDSLPGVNENNGAMALALGAANNGSAFNHGSNNGEASSSFVTRFESVNI